jgi:hypothetical protein
MQDQVLLAPDIVVYLTALVGVEPFWHNAHKHSERGKIEFSSICYRAYT